MREREEGLEDWRGFEEDLTMNAEVETIRGAYDEVGIVAIEGSRDFMEFHTSQTLQRRIFAWTIRNDS